MLTPLAGFTEDTVSTPRGTGLRRAKTRVGALVRSFKANSEVCEVETYGSGQPPPIPTTGIVFTLPSPYRTVIVPSYRSSISKLTGFSTRTTPGAIGKSNVDFKTYGILAAHYSGCDRKVECHSLPSKDYSIAVLDRVDIIPGTPIGSEIIK